MYIVMCKSVKERLDSVSSSEENLQELYSIFNSIEGHAIPMIRIDIEVGNYVVRQRSNSKDKIFSNISDLTYPPTQCCKDYGRANVRYHPMFYCCFFSFDKDAPLPRVLSLLETSDFAKDAESMGIERATCSRWDVVKKLELLALPFSNNYKRTISTIEQIKHGWEQMINNIKINKDALELVEYMSNEIAKETTNHFDYFKIANFIYYLLYINKGTSDMDGILYPSVAAEGEGFNIVLKPESVDAKLQFSLASLCYLVKNKEDEHVDIINHSIGLNEDGTLLYEEEPDFDKNKYDGCNFIN